MAGFERALLAVLDGLPGPVPVWWRDDDAGRDHPRLRRLLGLAEARDAELALAVVPAWLEQAAVDAIAACARASVLQHGIAHADHARPGEKKIELGGRAGPQDLMEALLAGMDRLRSAFPASFLPVLAPPWNRIAPAFVAELAGWGFSALSRFGPAGAAWPGLGEINAHVDLILWRDGARPMTLDELATATAEALHAAAGRPIGILSHHLVMDEAAFLALDRVLAVLQDHPNARLVGMRTLLREGG